MIRKNLVLLMLSLLILGGAALICGCAAPQTIEKITPSEAFNLIQENQGNPDFVIIDVQTPEDFANCHIYNAVSIDINSETFQNELDKLDKNKTYLLYGE